MADNIPVRIPFKRHLLYLAIAGAPALSLTDALADTVTNTPAPANQQWECQPQGEQWQCQSRQRPQGAYPPAPLAKIPKSSKYNTAQAEDTAAKTQPAKHPANPWDWVKKSQLPDPSVCQTGCDGAYVAPTPDWPDADKAPAQSPLHASAASSRMANNTVTLSGDVQVSQGNRHLSASEASLNRDTDQVVAGGGITFREPDLLVHGSRAEFSTDTALGHFEDASFVEYHNQLRGSASLIQRSSDNTLDLEQAMLTRCPPDDEVWKMKAGDIHLDNEEGWGSAKNATLNIHGVPVFYTPYITFPIDERRKTGFLWPTLSSSSRNGFEMSVPYYLNLAPNYDATITPRYIEKRGTMTALELRHLNSFGNWVLAGAYLHDQLYTDGANTSNPSANQDTPPQAERWIGSVKHSGEIDGFYTGIDYTKVSDNDFFRDLSTDSLELRRASHLNQSAAFGYNNEEWLSQVLVQQYQTIDAQLNQQYKILPRVSLEHLTGSANFAVDWLFDTEFTRFEHDQSWDNGGTFTTGNRSYGEIGASYPMRWAAGFITPTAKVRNVSYNLDATAPGADKTPSATSPLGSLDMGLIFERNAGSYLQTLEPRLYYLYSDYKDQSGNPRFDTRELAFSYSQLFRDTRFAGHDRLDDANQLSVGMTSRFIENTRGREVLSLSLGQIFYFDDRKVQLGPVTPLDQVSNSNIAAEAQFQPQDNLWLSSTLLWDSRRDLVNEGGLGVHYQSPGNSLYNFGYRYRRNGASNIGTGVRNLSQVDTSVVQPLSERWQAYARFRYDTEEHRTVDQLAGVRYEDCCWAVSILYQRGIDNEYLDQTSGQTVVQQSNVFVLEFQLKGLGSLGNKAQSILSENILGYKDLEQ